VVRRVVDMLLQVATGGVPYDDYRVADDELIADDI